MTHPTHKGRHRSTSPGQPVTQQRRLGAVRHRALMLAMQGEHLQAARLLIDHLQVRPEDFPTLDSESRRLLSVAATYLHKAGEAQEAAVLFEALGETARAAALDQGAPESTSFPTEETVPPQGCAELEAQGVSPEVPSEEDPDDAPVSALSNLRFERGTPSRLPASWPTRDIRTSPASAI